MLFNELLHNPKYYSAVIRSTGLLSGKAREDRIQVLLEENVWLAAKCKNTCVLEEDKIVDAIILKCAKIYEEEGSALPLVALLELGEVGVFSYLLDLGDKLAYRLYYDPKQSVSHFFCVLCENVEIELFWSLYRQIEDLGYPLEIETYNLALSRTPKDRDARSILGEMEVSGVQADATTYYHLISKSPSFESALIQYNIFKKIVGPTEHNLFAGCVNIMMHFAATKEDVALLYKDYKDYFIDRSPSKLVESTYCSRMISLSSGFIECEKALKEYNQIATQLKSNNKTFFRPISMAYCDLIGRIKTSSDGLVDSFRLFCDVSFLFGAHNGYYSKSGETTYKSVLDKSLHYSITHFKKIGIALEIISILEDYKIRVHPNLIWDSIQLTDSQRIVLSLLEKLNPVEFEPKTVSIAIRNLPINVVETIYSFLYTHNIPINSVLFNVFIKRMSFEKGIQLVDDMIKAGLSPDIQTIQPLLRKKFDRIGFLKTLSLCSKYNIKPDEQVFYTLRKQLKMSVEVKEIISSIYQKDIESFCIDQQWADLIADLQLSDK